MKVEIKELYAGTEAEKTKQIALMKKFGWQYTRDSHHGRSGGLHAVYGRDKDMPNYRLVAALEAKYFDLEKQKKHYSPITDSPEAFLLLLLFIFPFLIYLAFKSSQKDRINEHNANIERQQKKILKEVAPLV